MNSCRWLLIGLSLATSLLIGCARTGSSPPIVEYSEAFNVRLAQEIEQMSEDSATVRALGDCFVLRAQVRKAR